MLSASSAISFLALQVLVHKIHTMKLVHCLNDLSLTDLVFDLPVTSDYFSGIGSFKFVDFFAFSFASWQCKKQDTAFCENLVLKKLHLTV